MRHAGFLFATLVISGLGCSSSCAQVHEDVNARIAEYRTDKTIGFSSWPKGGKLIHHSTDLSNTLARFSANAFLLKARESSEVDGRKYERVTYRTWRDNAGQKEELTIWVTVMESVTSAHDYLLSRWANVSAPLAKHTKGAEIGLDLGDVCFVVPHPAGGMQVVWFTEANVVIEIRANGSFVTQTPALARAVDENIRSTTGE
jgi:hypothetical protein